ncbi:hypothetical protein LWC34_14040 [Kibdelosporangium philippinense]|uniref:Uncharacterized protein n=2 Tax=Kibdelosporangium philippinense TaxID=211113 RepID=A0ABS8ZB83_9PSEU|nr:hypothetical protein [Kibdelosporangium philippinense]MCE7003941.1 hypothetical protein [Kibdelosporangium philippinense]
MPSETAGPAVHAQSLLRPDERLLWATFSKVTTLDKRGIGAVGGKLAKFGKKNLDDFLAALTDAGDADPTPVPDVIAFYRSESDLAYQHGRRMSGLSHGLFALTTARMYLAQIGVHPGVVLDQPAPQPKPEPSGKKKGKFASFVDDMVQTGKDVAAAVSTDTKPARKKVAVHPIYPRVSIPREQIAEFSVESDGTVRKVHYLRMELVDRSGFEFFCGVVKEREQYERLLALTHGGPA